MGTWARWQGTRAEHARGHGDMGTRGTPLRGHVGKVTRGQGGVKDATQSRH